MANGALDDLHDSPTAEIVEKPAELADVVPDLPPADNDEAAPVESLESLGVPTSTTVSLVKDRNGNYQPVRDERLRNNLHFAVGLLELANAGDFAANVWNDIPVPVYAIVFMAIGATAAGVLSVFALRDARFAYANIKFLKRQWREAKQHREQLQQGSLPTHDISVLETVTFRELGTEFINRFSMDLLMGGGAVMICIGTYMAIGGANHKVFLASNILSGYAGNAPIALYGLVNFCWGMYLCVKAQEHIWAARERIPDTQAFQLVKRRSRLSQTYCGINGFATLVGGAGSMLAATRWWAYVILIPVIVSSFFCNLFWRRKIGYTRDYAGVDQSMSTHRMIDALSAAYPIEKKLRHDTKTPPLLLLGYETSSIEDIVAFLQGNGLLEEYCIKLLACPDIKDALIPNETDDGPVTINVEDIMALSANLHPNMRRAAQSCIRGVGALHFAYLRRYLSEAIGISLALDKKTEQETQREK